MKYVISTQNTKINTLKQSGVAAAGRNDWQSARNSFAEVLKAGVSDAESIRNYAVCCLRTSDIMEAARVFRDLLEKHGKGKLPDAHLREAAGTFFDAGWFIEAENVWRKCAVDVHAMHQLCRAILMQDTASSDKVEEAGKLADKVSGKIGGFDEAMLRGALAHRRKDNTEAVKWFNMASGLRPGDISALSNLARIQKAGKDAAGFADTARRICAIQPDCEWLSEDLGEERPGALADTEIEKMIRTAIEYKASAANWNGLAKYYQSRLKLHAAKLAFDKALEVAKNTPDEIKLLWNCSLLMLLMGDFERGRELYESRLELSGTIHVSKIQPQWNGEQLYGRTLMIYSEQGMGDVIQFARFVPLVKKYFGGIVKLVVQKPLVPLFKNLPGVDEVLEYVAGVQAQEICRYDCACAIMSLPHKMKLLYPQYPRESYISTAGLEPNEETKKAVEALRNDSRLKVGFCSSGNPDLPRTKLRDCPSEKFAELFGGEALLWVNLNRNFSGTDYGAGTINYMETTQNFVDTAAIVEACDVVVTVDTAMAHLSGAIGKPVWLMLFYESEWRWGVNVEDNYWYPTMKVFRQPDFGDWDEPIQRIRTGLANMLEERRKEAISSNTAEVLS